MTERSPKRGFVARPGDPDSWVRAPAPSTNLTSNAEFTARLTIDVTPALRARIKIAAFWRGLTVGDTLRELLDREFSADGRAAPCPRRLLTRSRMLS
jgi:hypothetical protein